MFGEPGNAAGLLVSRHVFDRHGERIRAVAAECGRKIRLHVAPSDTDQPCTAEVLNDIRAAFYSRDIWTGSSMARQSAASVAFFRTVDASSHLCWLHVCSAGTDLKQFPQYAPSMGRGARLTTSSGSNALPIAQTVVAAILAHARGFVQWLPAQRDGRWAPLSGTSLPRDLDEQNAVIIGMGPIGMEVGRLLKMLGMRTVGVRRVPEAAPGFDSVQRYQDLDTILPHADFVVLACPLTEETTGLLNAARLALLPHTASVVNVGRGELTDEAALADALIGGRLRSAYLDVFAQEPLPGNSPLWHLPNVWISPHNSSASQGNEKRVNAIFLDRLRSWLVESNP